MLLNSTLKNGKDGTGETVWLGTKAQSPAPTSGSLVTLTLTSVALMSSPSLHKYLTIIYMHTDTYT